MKSFTMMKKNKGVTLIEVIIATAILAVMSTSIISVFCASARVNQKAHIRQATTSLATDIMETFKAKRLNELFNELNELYQTNTGSVEVGGETVSGADHNVMAETSGPDEHNLVDSYHIRINDIGGYRADVICERDINYGINGEAFGHPEFEQWGLSQGFKYNITVKLFYKGDDTFSNPTAEMIGSKVEMVNVKYPTASPTPTGTP